MRLQWGLRLLSPARLLQNLVEPAGSRECRTERERLLAAMADAHREWEHAVAYFQGVSEPELVDHAIFVMEAARRKYSYLMNRARRDQAISARNELA